MLAEAIRRRRNGRGWPVPVLVLLGGSLTSCSDAGTDPAENGNAPTDARAARQLDLKSEFVPGDPTFERDPALDVDNISTHDDTRSHTVSQNCLSCHQDKGPGLGQFTIAGTLVDGDGKPLPNAVLKLFQTAQAPGGGPVAWGGPVELADEVFSLELDANGNFYSTKSLPEPFPNEPLYPQFFSESGEPLLGGNPDSLAIMGSGVQVGGCNFCHDKDFPIVAQTP